ncbi:tRNA (adenosine(37)-N6)-threonylcarbamoyltransferase complex transferase subunit TsaD [Candidatus Microgenomates bacterium]|nr:tRNA (adenosine(37)-N6)-threonylcarbamoyltransferase complex transferase subunit TsaD [Candidatus Microgenomates bacterium]
MLILAIETSCDETAVALVENGTKIVSSVLSSSQDLHKKTGGVIPEQAAREQIKCMIPVLDEALKVAFSNRTLSETVSQIDALAVTYGPGLIGSLLIGIETAKTLSYLWQKPLIPVNHLIAHLYANWLENNKVNYIKPNTDVFPALCLVVSGGHTDLVLMKNHGQLSYLGGTRDDAAGEAFDKTARLLGLAGFMGGPAIAAAAEKYRQQSEKNLPKITLPRPMINSEDFDFSFSGLKTAVVNEVKKLQQTNDFNTQTINALSYEIQEAITDVFEKKIFKALNVFKPKAFLVAGGVSANLVLREKLKNVCAKTKVQFFVPPIRLCNDNAAYIGSYAFFNYHPAPLLKISANPTLEII